MLLKNYKTASTFLIDETHPRTLTVFIWCWALIRKLKNQPATIRKIPVHLILAPSVYFVQCSTFLLEYMNKI